MEDQDKLGGSCDIWRYIHDIVVQGDWEDRTDDFTFEKVNEGSGMGGRAWNVSVTCQHR